MSERTQDHHLIVVLQCDECGAPRTGCRDTACALVARPYTGEDVVPASQFAGAVDVLDLVYRTVNDPGLTEYEVRERIGRVVGKTLHPKWALS